MKKSSGRLAVEASNMRIVRHPDLASDVKEVAEHYADVSEKILNAFWTELDSILDSTKRNPRKHHYDSCGLRRTNFKKYPYHLLYDVADDHVLLVVLRHDLRHPSYGLERIKES